MTVFKKESREEKIGMKWGKKGRIKRASSGIGVRMARKTSGSLPPERKSFQSPDAVRGGRNIGRPRHPFFFNSKKRKTCSNNRKRGNPGKKGSGLFIVVSPLRGRIERRRTLLFGNDWRSVLRKERNEEIDVGQPRDILSIWVYGPPVNEFPEEPLILVRESLVLGDYL